MTTDNRLWVSPPADLSLSIQDVHVWRASLRMSPLRLQGLDRTLSEEEFGEGETFDRESFIAAPLGGSG
jgi:4'-phosphopantetheinyl transferase